MQGKELAPKMSAKGSKMSAESSNKKRQRKGFPGLYYAAMKGRSEAARRGVALGEPSGGPSLMYTAFIVCGNPRA
jgi:hypothetical protein